MQATFAYAYRAKPSDGETPQIRQLDWPDAVPLVPGTKVLLRDARGFDVFRQVESVDVTIGLPSAEVFVTLGPDPDHERRDGADQYR